MSLEKLKNSLVPSLFAGVAGVGIYYFLYDHDLMTQIPFAGIEVPVSLAVGGSVMLGNMAGEILTQYVLPLIPKNENVQPYEEYIIPPLVAAASSYLVMRTLVSEDTHILPALVTGGSGSYIGKIIYGMI